MAIPIELARWRRLQSTEARASLCASASTSRYRLAENIGFFAVVETELKLSEVQGQILLAHVMMCADDAPLQQAPEVFQIVGMYFATNILTRAMANRFVAVAECFKIAIAAVLVGRDKINLVAHGLAHEAIECSCVGVFDDLADYVTFTGNRADDADLARADTASDVRFLIPVAILVFPAKERLVHFHNAHELTEIRVFHRGAQPMAHIPRCLVRSRTNLALNLKRAYALLGIEHLPENLKPRLERIFGILKNRPADDAEAIVLAKLAEPVERPRVEFVDGRVAAFRASDNAVLPAPFHQELL